MIGKWRKLGGDYYGKRLPLPGQYYVNFRIYRMAAKGWKLRIEIPVASAAKAKRLGDLCLAAIWPDIVDRIPNGKPRRA